MNTIFWINPIEYIRTHDCNAAQIETTVRRFLMKSYNFSIQGTRATKSELADFEQLIRKEPLPELTREEWETKIDEALADTKLTKDQQRSYRCFGLKFVNSLENLSYLLIVSPSNESNCLAKNLVIKRKKPELVVDKYLHHRTKPKRILQREIVLNFEATNYLEDYRFIYPELTDVERLKIIQSELDRLKKNLQEFQHYLGHRTKNSLCLASQQQTLDDIKRLVGWLSYRTQNLALIKLESLIPVVNKKINIHTFQCMQDYYETKGRLDAEAEQAADYVVEFLLDFFDNYGANYSKATKIFYIRALVNLAKFLYQKITCRTRNSNYQDIEVICALNSFAADLPKEPPKFQELFLTLNDVRKILEVYKQHIDDPNLYFTGKNGKVYIQKRSRKSRAKDLQRFLMLGFLCVVPPLRRRTLAELELGRTLVHGIETESGFISRDKMQNPDEAIFYYDMLPDDYKTGKIYGNYFVSVPNYRFQDGSCFYDYLNKWLYEEERDELLLNGQTHQCLFVRFQNNKLGDLAGDPTNEKCYTAIIAQITEKFTGIEIRPQIFRAIYRTHYVNIGAPPNVLESLAFFMQHSPETAAKVYTRRSLSEKLAPFKDFNLERDL
jgi:hypothetical protein